MSVTLRQTKGGFLPSHPDKVAVKQKKKGKKTYGNKVDYSSNQKIAALKAKKTK